MFHCCAYTVKTFFGLVFFTPIEYFVASVPVMELGPSNITVLDGKDATMNCRAAGAPTPNVTWIYNGKLNNFCICMILPQLGYDFM